MVVNMRSGSGEPWSTRMKSPGVRSELGAGTFVVLEGEGVAGGELGVIARSLTRGRVGRCKMMREAAGSTSALICSFVRGGITGNLSLKACTHARIASIVAWCVTFHSANWSGRSVVCEPECVSAGGILFCGARGGSAAGGAG